MPKEIPDDPASLKDRHDSSGPDGPDDPEPPRSNTDKLDLLIGLVGNISTRQEMQGQMLLSILQLVAPKEGAGPQIADLLAQMIAKLDSLSNVMHETTKEISRIGRNLPLEVVRAIDDNLGMANGSGADHP
jgi:hypothetical protein